MPDFEVSVSPEEFDVTGSSRSVVGPIWVRVAGTDFPEPGWPDFPVALLGGWLTTLSELERIGPGPAMLHFMDGPYAIEIIRDGAVWVVHAQENEADIVAETVVTSLAELVSPVGAAASRALAACRERGWNGSDVRYLSWFTGR